MRAPKETSNLLLASMGESDRALIQPHLEFVELPLRRQLEQRNRRIEHIYFFDSGLASMVASAGADHTLEVGIVGFEGMSGLPVILGSDRPVYEMFIQTAGIARRVTTAKLREIASR